MLTRASQYAATSRSLAPALAASLSLHYKSSRLFIIASDRRLESNRVSDLPPGVFDKLSALTYLYVYPLPLMSMFQVFDLTLVHIVYASLFNYQGSRQQLVD